jgi:biopolymer transport protein ExbD
MEKALAQMMTERNVTLTDKQQKAFLQATQIGIPMQQLPQFLEQSYENQLKLLKSTGIPTDSLTNREDQMSEFQLWVKALKKGYKEWYNEQDEAIKVKSADRLEICIKADKKAPYSTFKKVISELQDINESRYKLVTQYKKSDE